MHFKKVYVKYVNKYVGKQPNFFTWDKDLIWKIMQVPNSHLISMEFRVTVELDT